MWLNMWEKVRGYDKWIETTATLESPTPDDPVALEPDPVEFSAADRDVLVWTDLRGRRHGAPFIVPDDCALYQKVSGDTLLIRYNPRHPERFYFRQLHRIRIRTAFKRILIAASLIALIAIAIWVRQKR